MCPTLVQPASGPDDAAVAFGGDARVLPLGSRVGTPRLEPYARCHPKWPVIPERLTA